MVYKEALLGCPPSDPCPNNLKARSLKQVRSSETSLTLGPKIDLALKILVKRCE